MQRIIGFVGFLIAWRASAPTGLGIRLRRRRGARAEAGPQAAYKPLNRKPPAELAALTYDQYRDIRFSPDHALWRPEKLPFEVMFFHIGKFQIDPVRINEVTPQGEGQVKGKGTRHIAYDSADFNYGQNKLSPQRLGRSRLRRLSRALPVERRPVQRRACRVSRRELFPRARRGPALRVVRARPGHRYRGREG